MKRVYIEQFALESLNTSWATNLEAYSCQAMEHEEQRIEFAAVSMSVINLRAEVAHLKAERDAMALIADAHAESRLVLADDIKRLKAELDRVKAENGGLKKVNGLLLSSLDCTKAECAAYRVALRCTGSGELCKIRPDLKCDVCRVLASQDAGKTMLEVVEATREYQHEMEWTGGAGPDRVIKALAALDDNK